MHNYVLIAADSRDIFYQLLTRPTTTALLTAKMENNKFSIVNQITLNETSARETLNIHFWRIKIRWKNVVDYDGGKEAFPLLFVESYLINIHDWKYIMKLSIPRRERAKKWQVHFIPPPTTRVATRKLAQFIRCETFYFHISFLVPLLLNSMRKLWIFQQSERREWEVIAVHCMWQWLVVRKQMLLNLKRNYIHFMFSHQTRRWARSLIWFQAALPSVCRVRPSTHPRLNANSPSAVN